MKESFVLLENTLTNQQTGETVPGLTLVVDGRIREVLDGILRLSPDYKGYNQVVGAALGKGITEILNSLKPQEP